MKIIVNEIENEEETDALINKLWLAVKPIAPKGTTGYAEKLIHPTTGLTACQIIDTKYYKDSVYGAITESEIDSIEEKTEDWNPKD